MFERVCDVTRCVWRTLCQLQVESKIRGAWENTRGTRFADSGKFNLDSIQETVRDHDDSVLQKAVVSTRPGRMGRKRP
jgi:hypothetical protein